VEQLQDHVRAFTGGIAADDQALFVPGWGAAEWSALFSYATAVSLKPGATLLQQGEAGRTIYLVVGGTVEVAVHGEQTLGSLRRLGPGSVVGEVSFFDGGVRMAKVWAVEDSQLLRLNFDDYERFAAANVQRASEFLFALGRLVALRLRHILSRAKG
jgi:CRP-like cAMP-binding protein